MTGKLHKLFFRRVYFCWKHHVFMKNIPDKKRPYEWVFVCPKCLNDWYYNYCERMLWRGYNISEFKEGGIVSKDQISRLR